MMKKLLIVVVLLVAGIAGLGFYRGWFSVASDSAKAKSNITFSVDKDKVQKDEETVVEKVRDVGHQAQEKVEKVRDAGHQAQEKAAAPDEERMDGTLVRAGSDELTMTTKAGEEQTHALAAGVKVSCDGGVCTAADLKAGMKIRVTTEHDSPHAATRIEALDKHSAFEAG
jgi:hypothetical protein